MIKRGPDANYEDEMLTIHIAKHIITQNCRIYKPDVLSFITIGDIVRISIQLEDNYRWTHDSPYVKIIELEDNNILGEVYDLNRQLVNLYPINIGDRIWFGTENIIEIPCDYLANKENLVRISNVYKCITNKVVRCNGPLFTIANKEDSDSDDDDNDEDSDDNSDEEGLEDNEKDIEGNSKPSNTKTSGKKYNLSEKSYSTVSDSDSD